MTKHEFQQTVNISLPYLLLPPKTKGIEVSDDRQYPLILFLHGGGERGTDLSAVEQVGLIPHRNHMEDFAFYVLAPQCPPTDWWPSYQDLLLALLDDVLANHPIDRTRFYLTGLSIGGMGTWHLATRHAGRFAAIAPVCGFGHVWYSSPKRLPLLKDTPTWVFHGVDDPVIPVEESINMTKALRAYGGDVCLTLYPDTDHNAWDATYSNPELYDWFLKHRLSS